jgi:glycerate-2-kinase
VLTADLAVAETMAAAALAMGRDGIERAATQPGCLVLAVTAEGLLQCSTDADDLLEHV